MRPRRAALALPPRRRKGRWHESLSDLIGCSVLQGASPQPEYVLRADASSLSSVCTCGTPEAQPLGGRQRRSPTSQWPALPGIWPGSAGGPLTRRRPGSFASSATSSGTRRPCRPPSALSSSMAMAARFSQATAKIAPGPDLLLSRPTRYPQPSAGWSAGQPRRHSSHCTPRSSIAALTPTLMELAPARSRRIRSRPRRGWSYCDLPSYGGGNDPADWGECLACRSSRRCGA
jgi:hypothetical protein